MGACDLQINYQDEQGHNDPSEQVNQFTEYFYTRMDKCTPDGQVTITMYSDSMCTRPMRRDMVNFGQAFPDFNRCLPTMQGNDAPPFMASMTRCVPPPDHHNQNHND
jgi:hypothetical protein